MIKPPKKPLQTHRNRLNVKPEQAYEILIGMESPSLDGLHEILVNKFKDEAPKRDTLNRWSPRYNWMKRLRVHQIKLGLIQEEQEDGSIKPAPFAPLDVDKFVAIEELRTIAANLTAVVKEATSPRPMSDECKVVLAESQSIVRLAEVAIKCVTACEDLMTSTNERKAKENAATAAENVSDTNDYVFLANKRLDELAKAGVPLN